jgi:hypothetical protein
MSFLIMMKVAARDGAAAQRVGGPRCRRPPVGAREWLNTRVNKAAADFSATARVSLLRPVAGKEKTATGKGERAFTSDALPHSLAFNEHGSAPRK